MNTIQRLSLLVTLGCSFHIQADPQISSWYTEKSGRYAKIFESTADESAGSYVTTWSRGQTDQTLPVYAGIQEVAHSDNWFYIKASGLGTHVMGPWYLDVNKTQDFPNFPGNAAVFYRFPKVPRITENKTVTGAGVIGYFVDGVALFDATDTFSYSTANNRDGSPVANIGRGDGVWNRDAWINEGMTFDASQAHQAGSTYHYHANTPAVRFQLNGNVDYNDSTNTYTENFKGIHSPILGWVADGIPLYGPYGYSNPSDPNSGIRRMISGYQKRDGSNGSTNLSQTGRTSLPQWVQTLQGRSTAISANQYGPDVNNTFILGHYLEDYTYKGDLGLTLFEGEGTFNASTQFDLNEHNTRFCITPEFPEGTWAYFTTIESDGAPAFPYNIGRAFLGEPTGGSLTSYPSDDGEITVDFESPLVTDEKPDFSQNGSTLKIEWSALEGGTYTISSSTSLDNWKPESSNVKPQLNKLTIEQETSGDNDHKFFRIQRTGLEDYDDTAFGSGGGNPGGGNPGGGQQGTGDGTLDFEARFNATPPLPPQNALNSVTVGGVAADIISYDQQNGIIGVDFDSSGLAPGNYDVIISFAPPGRDPVILNSNNQYTKN